MFPQPQSGNTGHMNSGNFLPQGSTAPIPSHMTSQAQTGQLPQSANYSPQHGAANANTTSHLVSQSPMNEASQFSSGNFIVQQGNAAPYTHQPHGVSGGKQNEVVGSLLVVGANAPNASQNAMPSTGSNYMVSQPSKDKFETKSTVWSDTLSRGLVDLNISGGECLSLFNLTLLFLAFQFL